LRVLLPTPLETISGVAAQRSSEEADHKKIDLKGAYIRFL
jgi:hypothetical protein